MLTKLAAMPEQDRALAERMHAHHHRQRPEPPPRGLGYGMPALAKDCETSASSNPPRKFKTRYATLGFNDNAILDEGTMWPTAFALQGADQSRRAARISALVKKAVS